MLCCNSVPFTTKPSGKPAPLRNCWYGVLTERPRWGEISLGQRHVGGGDGTSDCERAPGTTLTSWLTDVFIEDQLQWESVSLFLGKCREAGVPNAGEFSGLHRVCVGPGRSTGLLKQSEGHSSRELGAPWVGGTAQKATCGTELGSSKFNCPLLCLSWISLLGSEH